MGLEMTDEARRVEADRLVSDLWDKRNRMAEHEQKFVSRCEMGNTFISEKMLLWLRDLQRKYVLGI